MVLCPCILTLSLLVTDPTADATWSAPTIISSLGINQTLEPGLRMAVRAVSRRACCACYSDTLLPP